MNPSSTTNRLHFEDLEPRRFEDLSFEILNRTKKWKRINHTGALGNDGGVDIYGVTDEDHVYYCQVKRLREASKADITSIVNKVLENNSIEINSTLIYIFACDLSATTITYAYDYAKKRGFANAELFTAKNLEAHLYNKHKDLLKKYFGIDCFTSHSKAEEVRYSLEMKLVAEQKLLITDFYKKYTNAQLIKDPSIKFRYDALIIRSVNDTQYPDSDENNPFEWFKAFPYNFLDDGLEILLDSYIDTRIAFNTKTFEWRKVTNDDVLLRDELFIHCDYVGFLPYYEIVAIVEDGDSYFSFPIIHCYFNCFNSPFSQRYLKCRGCNVNFIEGKILDNYDINHICSYINQIM